MSHTPSPWRQFDKDENRVMIMGPRGFHVASVPVFEAADADNANLITAAPDLLAALELVLPIVENVVGASRVETSKVVAKCRAALSLAAHGRAA